MFATEPVDVFARNVGIFTNNMVVHLITWHLYGKLNKRFVRKTVIQMRMVNSCDTLALHPKSGSHLKKVQNQHYGFDFNGRTITFWVEEQHSEFDAI